MARSGVSRGGDPGGGVRVSTTHNKRGGQERHQFAVRGWHGVRPTASERGRDAYYSGPVVREHCPADRDCIFMFPQGLLRSRLTARFQEQPVVKYSMISSVVVTHKLPMPARPFEVRMMSVLLNRAYLAACPHKSGDPGLSRYAGPTCLQRDRTLIYPAQGCPLARVAGSWLLHGCERPSRMSRGYEHIVCGCRDIDPSLNAVRAVCCTRVDDEIWVFPLFGEPSS
jgi:hypothetical protein